MSSIIISCFIPRLFAGYGMTETSPVTLFARRGAPMSKTGSCGQLLPLTQGKVVDLTTGESLGPHQSGELWIKGPQVSANITVKLK